MTNTILVDMDGVLAKWEEQYVTDFRRLFPHIPTGDAGTRDRFNIFNGDPEHDAAVRAVMDDAGFYARIEPIPGGREALEALDKLGVDVALCSTPTHTNPTCASDKYDWTVEHLGSKWADRIVLTHDKTRVKGTILVDDKDTIHGSQKPVWEQVFFTQLYNAHLPGRRIDSWDQWPLLLENFPARSVR